MSETQIGGAVVRGPAGTGLQCLGAYFYMAIDRGAVSLFFGRRIRVMYKEWDVKVFFPPFFARPVLY